MSDRWLLLTGTTWYLSKFVYLIGISPLIILFKCIASHVATAFIFPFYRNMKILGQHKREKERFWSSDWCPASRINRNVCVSTKKTTTKNHSNETHEVILLPFYPVECSRFPHFVFGKILVRLKSCRYKITSYQWWRFCLSFLPLRSIKYLTRLWFHVHLFRIYPLFLCLCNDIVQSEWTVAGTKVIQMSNTPLADKRLCG